MDAAALPVDVLAVAMTVAHRGHEHAQESATMGYEEITLVVALLASLGVITWYAYTVVW